MVDDDARKMSAGQDDPRGSLSLDDYLAAIDATDVVTDLLYGWWSITGGGQPAEGCVEGVLGAITTEGAVGDMAYLRYAPVQGWQALAEAMAATEGLDVRLASRVTKISQSGETVKVQTNDHQYRAAAAIVAVPVNALPAIDFVPAPSKPTEMSFGTSSGKAIKVWLRVRGVPTRSLAFGRGAGLNWLYGDRSVGDDTLVVGFGWPIDGFDPDDSKHLGRALKTFYPDAELIDHVRHDWITDPSSLGTWVNTPAGDPEVLRAAQISTVRRRRIRDIGFC